LQVFFAASRMVGRMIAGDSRQAIVWKRVELSDIADTTHRERRPKFSTGHGIPYRLIRILIVPKLA
jgi:hypothetical protein